jgi:hypothetical protein
MPEEACENGLLLRIVPVDVSEDGYPVSISHLGTVRKRKVRTVQDVIRVLVDWTPAIQGGTSAVWRRPSRDGHEEEAVFVLARVGKNIVEEDRAMSVNR